MNRVSINGKTVAYEEDAKSIGKYMIKDASIVDVRITDESRIMAFSNGDTLMIEAIDKEVGTQAGDICQICKAGELKDYGGCASCENCGAQLKCGL